MKRKGKKSTPAKRPRALWKGSLTSKLERLELVRIAMMLLSSGQIAKASGLDSRAVDTSELSSRLSVDIHTSLVWFVYRHLLLQLSCPCRQVCCWSEKKAARCAEC
eukprot:696714-Pelagomonas_calceolata.AAC.1